MVENAVAMVENTVENTSSPDATPEVPPSVKVHLEPVLVELNKELNTLLGELHYIFHVPYPTVSLAQNIAYVVYAILSYGSVKLYGFAIAFVYLPKGLTQPIPPLPCR